jgi:hypothetical protein
MKPMGLAAGAVPVFVGPFGAAIAIIAIGFTVAAANGPVFARAESRDLDAKAGNVSSIAEPRFAVAPQALPARNAGDPAAHLAEPRAGPPLSHRHSRQGGEDCKYSNRHSGHVSSYTGSGTPAAAKAVA